MRSRAREIVAWAFLALLAATVGCAPVGQPQPQPQGDGMREKSGVATDRARRFALLVGVSTYNDPSGTFPNLAYPEADVTELAAALRTGGYRAEDVVVMTVSAGGQNPRLTPTAANIKSRLTEVLGKCGPDDVLIVGFTGHGVELAAGQPHFCAYQCRTDAPNTLVNLISVQEQMASAGAGTKVLISDACRVAGSKAPTGPRKVAENNLPSVTAKPNTAMITYFSCNSGEFSWESDELRHGLFFAHLIKGLNGEAAVHGDGKITWSDVNGYVERRIAAHNEKFPNRKQTPHFKGDISRAAPLVLRTPTAAPAPASNPAPAKPEPAGEAGAIEKTVPLNMTIASGDPRVEIILTKIDLRNDRRMRWHFTVWNKAGKDVVYELSPTSSRYATDDQGRRSEPLDASHGQSGFGLRVPDGEKVNYWMDFQEPFPGAKVLTARFTKWSFGQTFPPIIVSLAGAAAPGGGSAGATGTLVLKSGTKIRKDVEAWVEIDGVRVATWPPETTECEVTVAAGNRRVAVYSTFQKKTAKVFDQNGTVTANERTTIVVAK